MRQLTCSLSTVAGTWAIWCCWAGSTLRRVRWQRSRNWSDRMAGSVAGRRRRCCCIRLHGRHRRERCFEAVTCMSSCASTFRHASETLINELHIGHLVGTCHDDHCDRRSSHPHGSCRGPAPWSPEPDRRSGSTHWRRCKQIWSSCRTSTSTISTCQRCDGWTGTYVSWFHRAPLVFCERRHPGWHAGSRRSVLATPSALTEFTSKRCRPTTTDGAGRGPDIKRPLLDSSSE